MDTGDFMRRGIFIASGIALACLSGLAIAPAAEAGSSSTVTSTTPTREERQLAIDDWLDSWIGVAEDRREAIPGYSSTTLNVDAGVVTLYWKGDPPPDLKAAIDHPPAGVTVEVRPARYSRSEMAVGRDKIWAKVNPNTGTGIGTGSITSVSYSATGDGLHVTYGDAGMTGTHSTTGTTQSAPLTVTAPVDPAQVDADVTAVAGIAVDVQPDQGSGQTSRQADNSPWYGGAAVSFPVNAGEHCSDGFSVYGATGISFMLTAGHCAFKSGVGYLAGTWYNNGSGTAQKVIGTTYVASAPWDVVSIKIASGTANSAIIYDGSNTTSATHTISGHYSNWIGDYVCGSGANSGTHCNLRVSSDNFSWTMSGTLMKALIVADSPSTAAAVVGGDSGGPVITTGDYSLPSRTARGIIDGGLTSTTCPAVVVATTKCYRSLVYVPIRPILTALNVTLRTA